jgi:hypothetical protein
MNFISGAYPDDHDLDQLSSTDSIPASAFSEDDNSPIDQNTSHLVRSPLSAHSHRSDIESNERFEQGDLVPDPTRAIPIQHAYSDVDAGSGEPIGTLPLSPNAQS